MTIQNRREIEKEKFMQLVIDAALKIMESESMTSISIRKIASIIDYSPSLIYHYFNDKDDIINHILVHKYMQMNQKLAKASLGIEDPMMKFKNTLKSFILFGLENEKDYIEVLTSRHEEILKHTKVLFKGVSDIKPGFKMMREHIVSLTGLSKEKAEIVAQIIWSSTFGLLMRLHIENVNETYRNELIEHHIDYHVNQLTHIGKKE